MTQDQRRQDMMRLAMTAGTEFIITIGLLIGGGLLLDRWLDTRIWFTLLGAVLGFAGALYRLVRQAKAATRDDDKDGKQ